MVMIYVTFDIDTSVVLKTILCIVSCIFEVLKIIFYNKINMHPMKIIAIAISFWFAPDPTFDFGLMKIYFATNRPPKFISQLYARFRILLEYRVVE